jgi:hypothetical protein
MVLDHNKLSGTGLPCSLLRFWRIVLTTSYLEITDQTAFRLTWRRCAILATISVCITALVVWNHIGFYLDDIFFPQWKNCAVDSPLFVVGNARSGTTWLHRLITKETNRFTTLKTWEIIFAPSVSWRVLFGSLYYLDSLLLSGFIMKLVVLCEAGLLGDKATRAASVHDLGLFEAEEDEFLMIHVGYAQLMLYFFPMASTLLHKLTLFDYVPEGDSVRDCLSEAVKAEIFGYYKECVQRHVYYHGHVCGRGRLIFVSKNPTFTLRIPTLYDTFPDARVVCLVRDPLHSVPSLVSFISKVRVLLPGCTGLRK